MDEAWAFLHDPRVGETGTPSSDLGSSFPTVLAERLISVLGGTSSEALMMAEEELASAYLERLRAAPPTAARAAQGECDGSSSEAASFAMGQLAMAHAVTAHAVARLVDESFERHLLSRSYEAYVRLLLEGEFTGRQIAVRLGKEEADVSRRLKSLREIGAVECRREGNRIVNFLTLAASAVLKHHNVGVLASGRATRPRPLEVERAVEDRREKLPPELRQPLSFGSGDPLGSVA